LTDVAFRAADRHRSARQPPTCAKRTRGRPVSVATKQPRGKKKSGQLSE